MLSAKGKLNVLGFLKMPHILRLVDLRSSLVTRNECISESVAGIYLTPGSRYQQVAVLHRQGTCTRELSAVERQVPVTIYSIGQAVVAKTLSYLHEVKRRFCVAFLDPPLCCICISGPFRRSERSDRMQLHLQEKQKRQVQHDHVQKSRRTVHWKCK